MQDYEYGSRGPSSPSLDRRTTPLPATISRQSTEILELPATLYGSEARKIKLLRKTSNEAGMLVKTKGRGNEPSKRSRNLIETKEVSRQPRHVIENADS
jgi:hypothetical protein